MNRKLFYLSSPYSSPDKSLEHDRFADTEFVTAQLLNLGVHVYSPIVHCHHMANTLFLPTSIDFWKPYCLNTLKRCDAMIVLKLPGWNVSNGVAYEMDYCVENGIPILPMQFGMSDEMIEWVHQANMKGVFE